MKISVEKDRCEGHGQCHIVDPDLFPLDEDGYSNVGQGRKVPVGEENQASIGVSACPVAALSIDVD
ncbi:ferredoxin [Prauserella muralis]|uniref:Uncharacterized protein n=1 Tax=Prauserella muralis TaxID=588067 RepID=A0A2V4ADL7_9PSEU|nr:ferredoxin [Prauserella muralis]PXY17418.1 hypothetical protein BAY60_34605 [Prauserella muralis]TWE23585.1 ferredoxin [Prauserella muralis]